MLITLHSEGYSPVVFIKLCKFNITLIHNNNVIITKKIKNYVEGGNIE